LKFSDECGQSRLGQIFQFEKIQIFQSSSSNRVSRM
jgi:hypothetical protein